MPAYVNPQTLGVTVFPHGTTMPEPWVRVDEALALAWQRIPYQYRKWVGDRIEEMSAPEKAAKDAAARDARRDRELAAAVDDSEAFMRALLRVLVSEINILRQAAGMQPRTLAQVRTQIRNAMGS